MSVITAPDESFTWPCIRPVAGCEARTARMSANATMTPIVRAAGSKRRQGATTHGQELSSALDESSPTGLAAPSTMNNAMAAGTSVVPSLLLVEDDVELCDLVGRFLSGEGFAVEAVHAGDAGVDRALSGGYALVLLDVMLGRSNGFDVLRRIRAASSVPVVMLTAKGDALDRIVGLEIGADDYLPKP